MRPDITPSHVTGAANLHNHWLIWELLPRKLLHAIRVPQDFYQKHSGLSKFGILGKCDRFESCVCLLGVDRVTLSPTTPPMTSRKDSTTFMWHFHFMTSAHLGGIYKKLPLPSSCTSFLSHLSNSYHIFLLFPSTTPPHYTSTCLSPFLRARSFWTSCP